MADVMVQSFERSIIPFVSVKFGQMVTSGGQTVHMTLSFTIFNDGFYTCFIKNVQCVCSLRGSHENKLSKVVLDSETVLGIGHERALSLEVRLVGDKLIPSFENCDVLVEMDVAGINRDYKHYVQKR